MEDALPCAGAAIGDHAEVGQAGGACDLGGDSLEVTDERVVVGGEIAERRDVPARHYQEVRRRGGIDVADRDRMLVLVHAFRPCLARADSAEEAVGHAPRITGLSANRKDS